MKKGQILGNVWDIRANAQFIRYYGIDQVVIYIYDKESDGYYLLTVDDNDNVIIDEWVNGRPCDWVGAEYHDHHEDTVGGLLFWERQIQMFSEG